MSCPLDRPPPPPATAPHAPAFAGFPTLPFFCSGTNDFSCNKTTDAAFTAGAVAFMQNITASYANSPGPQAATTFLLAIGPMSPTRPLAALQAAVAQAKAAGLSAAMIDMTNSTLDGCVVRARQRRICNASGRRQPRLKL